MDYTPVIIPKMLPAISTSQNMKTITIIRRGHAFHLRWGQFCLHKFVSLKPWKPQDFSAAKMEKQPAKSLDFEHQSWKWHQQPHWRWTTKKVQKQQFNLRTMRMTWARPWGIMGVYCFSHLIPTVRSSDLGEALSWIHLKMHHIEFAGLQYLKNILIVLCSFMIISIFIVWW